MKKIKRKSILIVIILVVIISSFVTRFTCFKNYFTKEESSNKGFSQGYNLESTSSIKLTDKIIPIICKELSLVPEYVSVFSIDDVVCDKVIMFFYEDKGDIYEGLCQLSINTEDDFYNVVISSIMKVPSDSPFTVHEMKSRACNSDVKYGVVSGVINNNDIKSININFCDNRVVNIVLGEDRAYCYIKEIENLGIQSIEALDHALNVSFRYTVEEKET